MVSKTKGTAAAAAASSDDAVMTVNERILRDCHNIYTDAENGLCHIAKDVGIELLAPRKKINIMLIGNHSAGKSSFINWYIEETVSHRHLSFFLSRLLVLVSGASQPASQPTTWRGSHR